MSTERPKKAVTDPSVLNAHPLVKNTFRLIRKTKADRWGMKRLKSPDCLPVHVADASAIRILLICDTLIKAVEHDGGRVEIRKRDKETLMYLVVDNQAVSFDIRDLTERHRNTGKDADEWGHRYFFVPTGVVAIKIYRGYREPFRYFWKDTKNRRVEDSLDEVLESCRAAAAHIKERMRREEASKRSWQESEGIRARGQKRYAQLDSWLTDWRKAQDIRSLVQDFVLEFERTGSEPTKEFSAFLDWARNQADQLDPAKFWVAHEKPLEYYYGIGRRLNL